MSLVIFVDGGCFPCRFFNMSISVAFSWPTRRLITILRLSCQRIGCQNFCPRMVQLAPVQLSTVMC
jgi:hypothetical protein